MHLKNYVCAHVFLIGLSLSYGVDHSGGSLPAENQVSADASGSGKNGVAVGNSQNQMIRPDSYTISPGDKLSFRVDEDREDPKILTISITGELEVPYLGRVPVAGKGLKQAAQEIKILLERQLYYQATVKLAVEEARLATVAIKPKTITVVGQVKAQGSQTLPIDEKLTLSKAILQAGGFAAFANGRKVAVHRKGSNGTKEIITADVLSVLKDGKTENDVDLQPDDMIIVPEKWINW
jgi:polysaccharide biosynthesis/export protein